MSVSWSAWRRQRSDPPDELKRALRRAARSTGRSEADLIREGVGLVTGTHRIAMSAGCRCSKAGSRTSPSGRMSFWQASAIGDHSRHERPAGDPRCQPAPSGCRPFRILPADASTNPLRRTPASLADRRVCGIGRHDVAGPEPARADRGQGLGKRVRAAGSTRAGGKSGSCSAATTSTGLRKDARSPGRASRGISVSSFVPPNERSTDSTIRSSAGPWASIAVTDAARARDGRRR